MKMLIGELDKTGDTRFAGPLRMLQWRSGGSDGDILLAPRDLRGKYRILPAGAGGFGYDPMFIPDGLTARLASFRDAVKQEISHRARAFCR